MQEQRPHPCHPATEKERHDQSTAMENGLSLGLQVHCPVQSPRPNEGPTKDIVAGTYCNHCSIHYMIIILI